MEQKIPGRNAGWLKQTNTPAISAIHQAAQPRVQLTGATGGDLSEASIDAPATDA